MKLKLYVTGTDGKGNPDDVQHVVAEMPAMELDEFLTIAPELASQRYLIPAFIAIRTHFDNKEKYAEVS
jgi:hypothetical protein